MDSIDTELTNQDLYGIDTLRVCLDDIGLERPVGAPEAILSRVRLSATTRRQVEHREARSERKRRMREERRSGKRKSPGSRGTRHHRSKEATRRRKRAHTWATNPFGCAIHGYGSHAIDRQLWEKYIAPLWTAYLPQDLTLHKYKRAPDGSHYGTKQKPYTIYTMDIIHSSLGVVYNGNSQYLFDLSS